MPIRAEATDMLGLSVSPRLCRHARPALATWARADSVLDYDFVRHAYTRHGGQPIAPAAAFTIDRPSPKWLMAANGEALLAFPAGVAARDGRGLAVHDAVTAMPLNSQLLGALAGAPGSLPQGWSLSPETALSATVVAINPAAHTLDIRLTGTPTAGRCALPFTSGPAFAASAGQSWTFSLSAALVSGSLAGLSDVNARLEFAPSNTGSAASVALTAAMARVHARAEAPAGASGVTGALTIDCAGSAAVDMTLRLAWPVLHQGAPTEPVLTGLEAVTRPADAIAAPLALASPFSAVVIARAQSHRRASAVAINLTDGTNIVNLRTRVSPNELGLAWRDNGNPTPTPDGVLTPGQRFAAACAYAPGDNALSVNGAAPVTSQNGAARPGLSLLHLGWDGTFPSSWNGHIERVIVLPRRVSNAELQVFSNLDHYS